MQIVSGSAFVPKTLVEVASSNPPDIFQNFGGGLLLKSFVNVGYVADLTSLWRDNNSLTKAYLPALMGPATLLTTRFTECPTKEYSPSSSTTTKRISQLRR